jgi:hypothetical protein
MCLQFGFVIFWRKDFGTKAAHKMLVKLTPGSRNWQLISLIDTVEVLLMILEASSTLTCVTLFIFNESLGNKRKMVGLVKEVLLKGTAQYS